MYGVIWKFFPILYCQFMFMFSFCILRRIVIPASSFDGKVKFLEKTRKSFGGGTFNISEGALLESYYSFLKEEYDLRRKAQAVLCCWVHWLTTTHEWLLVSFKGRMLCSVICVSIDLPTSRAQNFSRAQSVSFALGTTTIMGNEKWRTLRNFSISFKPVCKCVCDPIHFLNCMKTQTGF